MAVESQRDYHRSRATQSPISFPRTTTTLTHTATSTTGNSDLRGSFEGVTPGSDVLSTTLGNPVPVQRFRNGGATPSQHVNVYTTTHSSPSTYGVTTDHIRHQLRNNGHSKNNGVTKSGASNNHIISNGPHDRNPYDPYAYDPPPFIPPFNTDVYDTSTGNFGGGRDHITEEVSTITTTTGRTEPTTTTQPPSKIQNQIRRLKTFNHIIKYLMFTNLFF